MKRPTIEVNMDARCSICGSEGAMRNGICLLCAADRLRTGPFDFTAEGKFKAPKIKAADTNEGVIFGLSFTREVEIAEAERVQKLGATVLGQTMTLAITGTGTGFTKTVMFANLSKVSGTVTDDASVDIVFEFEWGAELHELPGLLSDFLPQRGTMLRVTGALQKKQQTLDFGERPAAVN